MAGVRADVAAEGPAAEDDVGGIVGGLEKKGVQDL